MQLSRLVCSSFGKSSTCKLLSNAFFVNKQQLRAILVYLFISTPYSTAKSATSVHAELAISDKGFRNCNQQEQIHTDISPIQAVLLFLYAFKRDSIES